VTETTDYFYTVEGWVDHFKSWQEDLRKKVKAGLDVTLEMQAGAIIIEEASQRAADDDAESLLAWARELKTKHVAGNRAFDTRLTEIVSRYPDRRFSTVYPMELRVIADSERARFGAWYELFPRSFSPEPGKHGTFRDCEAQLPRIARMGFDVLYLPPIHPVGKSFRKGKNNRLTAEPGEPGSPWAIGSSEGGHKSIHPELGTFEDFRRLVDTARESNIEIALDIAFQCAPDHPYIKEHPEWFRYRTDGSIQYAENPPKKYQDIVPFDFECDDWQNLWRELKSIFEFWAGQGIRIFRVDNPHTKTFPFWEWCVGALKAEYPEMIFLAEAFTRLKQMYRLAKLGFTQSYNYFPWRNSREELEKYFTEITQPPVVEFFRPNLWPNTPDILTQFLQTDGRAGFAIRFILAATLGASYGIYGPAFELCENAPREPGGEEYLDSEKFEIKRWDIASPQSLEGLITRVNQIRREHVALHSDCYLRFHHTDNPELIAYTKSVEGGGDAILTIVNLSPHYRHSGWLELPLEDFGLDLKKTYQMHDLLTDARYLWRGPRNYVQLDPAFSSAHIFRLRHHVRTENDFDYFM